GSQGAQGDRGDRRPMKTSISIAIVVAALCPGRSSAQSLDDRVAAARGPVAFEFATHGNVCGDGRSIFVSDDTSPGWNLRSRQSGMHVGHGSSDMRRCDIGLARVVVDHESVRLTVGGPVEAV